MMLLLALTWTQEACGNGDIWQVLSLALDWGSSSGLEVALAEKAIAKCLDPKWNIFFVDRSVQVSC